MIFKSKVTTERFEETYTAILAMHTKLHTEHSMLVDKLGLAHDAINKLVESNNNQNKVIDKLKAEMVDFPKNIAALIRIAVDETYKTDKLREQQEKDIDMLKVRTHSLQKTDADISESVRKAEKRTQDLGKIVEKHMAGTSATIKDLHKCVTESTSQVNLHKEIIDLIQEYITIDNEEKKKVLEPVVVVIEKAKEVADEAV